MFGWFKKKKSYRDRKIELETRIEVCRRMSSLSDNQMDRLIDAEVELKKLHQQYGGVASLASKRN
jgi:hypothetical protein